ncbi:hypothetical protein [Maribacter arcticus]|jgi:patatin-like phospholipase/acyl hydrolase|uniref:hypothetical protein n=1 Tax=Maribacter arcticus TaxID=561365 RepID=UPI0030014F80
MYKILSPDGGGSWAIIQLLTLKDSYGNLNGHEILEKFDLVIANSRGNIVLAALAKIIISIKQSLYLKLRRIEN